MKTEINNQSGGSAAETTSTHSNQATNHNLDMIKISNKPESAEATVTLKQAAAKFECAWTSLKNNIKSHKLPALQEGDRAPYMVRLSDVECFLRATPGIASMFHPAGAKVAANDTEHPPTVAKVDAGQQHEIKAQPAELAEPAVSTIKTSPVEDAPSAAPQIADSTQVVAVAKRRRPRRRRRKGGNSESPITPCTQLPVLKALADTTPQDRLRVVACLNELAGLVASPQ